jgi:hypothetical protein
MKTEDKDVMRNLFAQLHDEQLPRDFNLKVMEKIRLEAARKERMAGLQAVIGYVLCGAIMIAACIFACRYTGFSPELPDMQSLLRPFEQPDFEALKSPSFLFSLYIGGLALLLLVADSLLRRHYRK